MGEQKNTKKIPQLAEAWLLRDEFDDLNKSDPAIWASACAIYVGDKCIARKLRLPYGRTVLALAATDSGLLHESLLGRANQHKHPLVAAMWLDEPDLRRFVANNLSLNVLAAFHMFDHPQDADSSMPRERCESVLDHIARMTWTICAEFIGNLNDEEADDLLYDIATNLSPMLHSAHLEEHRHRWDRILIAVDELGTLWDIRLQGGDNDGKEKETEGEACVCEPSST